MGSPLLALYEQDQMSLLPPNMRGDSRAAFGQGCVRPSLGSPLFLNADGLDELAGRFPALGYSHQQERHSFGARKPLKSSLRSQPG
jgi:hypothetical protein